MIDHFNFGSSQNKLRKEISHFQLTICVWITKITTSIIIWYYFFLIIQQTEYLKYIILTELQK